MRDASLPRSAHTFSAVPQVEFVPHPNFPGPFKPTHVRVTNGVSVELLARGIFTWPTAYPMVLFRDDAGTIFAQPEETFDAVKRKKYVNYEPIEADDAN